MTQPETPDVYVSAAPERLRGLLERVRTQLARALPDAEEILMYGMPGFRIEGEIVVGYAAFSKHCGLYVDPAAINDHAGAIAALKLKATKTGVTFSDRRPITDELIRQLALASRRRRGL